ncbi:hypothetical protein HMI56_002183, partial [Coelomomyces lativittatus]
KSYRMNQFVTNLFKSTVSKVVNLGLSKDLPNVSIGERYDATHGIWTLYEGTMKDTGLPVTIFYFDSSNLKKDYFPLAQNAYKKLKSIRHPELLRFVDGALTETSVYLVTDRVKPFYTPTDPQLLILGMFKLATLLKFLNQECGYLHGFVHSKAIFVTDAEEWKLGGLELMSSPKEVSPLLCTHSSFLYASIASNVPPEFQTQGPHFPAQHPFSPDMYMFGCLLREWSQGKPWSASMQPLIDQYLAPYSQRIDGTLFLQHPLVSQSSLVTLTLRLESMNTMNEHERNAFVDQLGSAMETCPVKFKIHKILPLLLSAVELGTISPRNLISVFKISKHLDESQFKRLLVEPLLKLFASTDRALRMALLEHLETFVDRFDSKTIQSQIFPAVVLGFSDVVPVIREQTLKSMVLLAPKLNERMLNQDVMKYIGRSQTDVEPTIRTNACVCLAKLAPSLTSDTRSKILVPAFVRSLQDSFGPAKLAGLSSLTACLMYLERDPLATQVLPALTPLLLDTDRNILDTSFVLIEQILAHLKATIPPSPPQSSTSLSSTSTSGSVVNPSVSQGFNKPSRPPVHPSITSTPLNHPLSLSSTIPALQNVPPSGPSIALSTSLGLSNPPDPRSRVSPSTSDIPIQSLSFHPSKTSMSMNPTSWTSMSNPAVPSFPNAFQAFFPPPSQLQPQPPPSTPSSTAPPSQSSISSMPLTSVPAFPPPPSSSSSSSSQSTSSSSWGSKHAMMKTGSSSNGWDTNDPWG